MLTLLSFAMIIIIIVSVHEYGHYLAARLYGVRVMRFSVGLGPPLLSRRDKRGTEWVFAPIPLGGYVRLLDSDTAKAMQLPQKECFELQSHPRRIVIYAAGPLANIILSLLLAFATLAGGEEGLRPTIHTVKPHSAAAQAGLTPPADITAINEREILLWHQAEVAMADAIIAEGEIRLDTAAGTRYTMPQNAVPFSRLREESSGAMAAAGLYPYQGYVKLNIARVVPDAPAAAAGLRAGDEIVLIEGQLIESWRDAVQIIRANPERPLQFVIWRPQNANANTTNPTNATTPATNTTKGEAHTLTVTPRRLSRDGQEVGQIGVMPLIDREALKRQVITVSYTPPALAAAAFRQTTFDVWRAVTFMRLLIKGEAEKEAVSGPVGIAVQSGQAAELGLYAWLRFLALISTSLGILNLLPLPLLDGGQIALSMLQYALRRDFNDNILKLFNAVGIVLITSLIFFVIINDIIQLL